MHPEIKVSLQPSSSEQSIQVTVFGRVYTTSVCNKANLVNSALHPSGISISSTGLNWRECHLCRVEEKLRDPICWHSTAPTRTPTLAMRLSCNFVNMYTIAYRVQHTCARLHARIPNGHPREENRAACRTSRRGCPCRCRCPCRSHRIPAIRHVSLRSGEACFKLLYVVSIGTRLRQK